MSRRDRLLCCAALWLGAACAGTEPTTVAATDPCAPRAGAARTAGAAGLRLWVVDPQITDGCISQRLDSHVVFHAPGVASRGRLFVFLPGTGAIAQNYQLIVAEAARSGYHAVGISYPNEQAVGTLCAVQATGCHAATRLEILTGESASAVVSVDRANSIENRTAKLIRFLEQTDAAGGWGQFRLGDGTLDWSKISVAGHSQGGGHSLFIAQRYVVFRATAYASYGDVVAGGGVAPWVLAPFATPVNRLFGFISSEDELVSATNALNTWAAIGMSGAAVNVDAQGPPYGTAQRFVTSATPVNPGIVIGANHNVVAVDVNTPRARVLGTPIFAPTWRALSFP